MKGGAPSGAPSLLLHIDFETRSTLDLREVGLDNYAASPTTDVWCLGQALGDEPVFVGKGMLGTTLDHVRAGGLVVAHNASFELAIWNKILAARYGWPQLRPEQCICTMSMAYAMGLPGSLEKAGAALGLSELKDAKLARLMLQMASPRAIVNGKPVWWDEPDKVASLHAYCAQDVRAEQALYHRLMALSPFEQRVWTLDQRINQRGVMVDRVAARAAVAVSNVVQDQLAKEIREITANHVGFPTEVSRIKTWLKGRGQDVDALAKQDVVDLLVQPDLPPDVRRVLEIRQEAAKTSTAKFRPMIEASSADGRLRGMFQYHGANTGRWAARRVQVQNLPSPRILKDEAAVERVFTDLKRRPPDEFVRMCEMVYGPAPAVLADLIRGSLIAAPGHELLDVDYANIEGRVLAWLAGEEWKLDAFRAFDSGKGPDLYLVAAARIFHCAPEAARPNRQIGKVAELALGYGGGKGAFQTMAQTLGLKLADAQAEGIKEAWREAHPAIKSYWYALERAAVNAVLNQGSTFTAGAKGREVKFKTSGSFLWCCLPSGRLLCYPYPKVLPVDTPWGETKDALTYMTVCDSQARKKAKICDDPANGGDWWRIATYGGSLAENVTQAAARDILAEALVRLDAAGFQIVLHVHDSIVSEERLGSNRLDEMKQIMEQAPAWAGGLPIAVAGHTGNRYRK